MVCLLHECLRSPYTILPKGFGNVRRVGRAFVAGELQCFARQSYLKGCSQNLGNSCVGKAFRLGSQARIVCAE
jgi:hypothetical protein